MKQTTCKNSYRMFTSILWVLILGLILGAIAAFSFHGDTRDCGSITAALAAGFAAAYILLSLLDGFIQCRAIRSNPLPADLDLSDRSIAREQADALPGAAPLLRHIRRLLAAWGAGASGPQVAVMATAQMNRALVTLGVEFGAIAVLLFGIAGLGPDAIFFQVAAALTILLALIALARFQLASRAAGYIESHLLARIGNDTPAAAASSFAEAAAQSVAASTAALAAVQEKSSAALAAAQEKAATTLAQAQSAVAEQLGRVTALASSIDQILKLQQSVDGTLKGVATADEFKSTLLELKRHLAGSDELLKSVAKPRVIRLVEKDND